MISKFVREQKRYTQQELCDILDCNELNVVSYIRKLKEYGVLKSVRSSDVQKELSELQEEDIEIADVEAGENEFLYVFTFVGVIVVAGCVLKCYPKYLYNVDDPTEELQQIIKVLEKYNSDEQIIRMFNENNESQSFNLLAVLLFLLQDYYENGIYINTEEIIESNGIGEILWDRTINETFMLLSNSRPYYIDLRTRRRIEDEFDYFKKLHECIVTIASKELQEADLLELFEIPEVELTDKGIDDFGDKEYILYRIDKELNMQFNTRKQQVLKIIHAYIERSGSLCDIDCFSVFGTNKFNRVWERVCADIMDNQLDRPLGSLELPIQLKSEYDSKQKLIELIEKPFWSATGKCAKKTLIPDLISISKSKNGYDFVIFDAKYYNARLEMNVEPKGQPGIESITKQYLYQLAYQKFIKDHEFSRVRNCFLLPTGKDVMESKGEVSMKILENLGLENIRIRFLSASDAYKYYLAGRKMDINKLELD